MILRGEGRTEAAMNGDLTKVSHRQRPLRLVLLYLCSVLVVHYIAIADILLFCKLHYKNSPPFNGSDKVQFFFRSLVEVHSQTRTDKPH